MGQPTPKEYLFNEVIALAKQYRQQIIEWLEDYNTRIYRTDMIGAILMRSDGKNIEMVDWK